MFHLFQKSTPVAAPVEYLIVGLGNPGRQYESTRHNAGFIVLDTLAEKLNVSIDRVKFKGLSCTAVLEGKGVLLLKPSTYMNLSGQSIVEVMNLYKVEIENLIVIYDDISLAPGQLRVRKKGSAGGHNGIKNIIAQLGTQNFLRVKVGVGEKPAGWDLADYVLGHFSKEEQVLMEEAFLRAADAASALLTEDVERVMNQYNTHK